MLNLPWTIKDGIVSDSKGNDIFVSDCERDLPVADLIVSAPEKDELIKELCETTIKSIQRKAYSSHFALNGNGKDAKDHSLNFWKHYATDYERSALKKAGFSFSELNS